MRFCWRARSQSVSRQGQARLHHLLLSLSHSVVGAIVHADERLEEAGSERLARDGADGRLDVATQPGVQPVAGHHRLNCRRPERLNDAELRSQLRVAAELELEHLGVDGRSVDLTTGHFADRFLVRPGGDRATEEGPPLAHPGQVVKRGEISGVGGGLVGGPGVPANLLDPVVRVRGAYYQTGEL